MAGDYAAEQGDGGMDRDLIPWLNREWHLDLCVSEFPYFLYAGPEDSLEIKEWLDLYGVNDIWTLPPSVRESSTYRTDLAAVRVDERAVERRERGTDGNRPLIYGEGWGRKQPLLRAYLNFIRDGPMTRDYYVHTHGLDGSPNSQPAHIAGSAVDRLKGMGFLRPEPGGNGLEAVEFGLLYAESHAIELKREVGEWRTALEQAARADVYADYRWVCMSAATDHRAVRNADAFEREGVGLMTVSAEGVRIHVDADRVTPPEDHELLSRPYCERWNLNERVLRRWKARRG